MRSPIAREQFSDAFRTYQHTARRLEPRDRYNVGHEVEEVKNYLAGKLVDYSFMNEWTAMIRAGRDHGRRMQRVRIVTEPLTDHIRYLMNVARFNCAAGDEIRYLPRKQATDLGIPDDEDIWVFDASWAVIINFDDDDQVVGYEREDDPAELLRWLQHWDAAWHYSVGRDEYAARHGVE